MVIQHNMAAANTNRMLGNIGTASAKSTEKLSSGFRINRAADDAAGLSISEKMRAQVRGLDQASTNAQDGISLIQTAEGALNESHAILQRMRELSVQASNGTVTDSDRDDISNEISQLQEELTRIADTTEFNTMKLLDGSFAEKGVDENFKLVGGSNAFNSSTASAASSAAHAMDGTDFNGVSTAVKDTITVDGYNIEIDWDEAIANYEKSTEIFKNGLSTIDSDAQYNELATFVEDTINKAIDKANADNGSNIGKVEVKFNDTDDKFEINGTTEGTNGSLEIATAANSVLNKMFVGGVAKESGTFEFAGTINANDSFKVDINGYKTKGEISIAIDNTTTPDDVAAELQTQLQQVITDAMDLQGLKAGDEGFIKADDVTVTFNNGKLEINGPEGINISFGDDAVSQALGLNSDAVESATEAAKDGKEMKLQVGANEGQTLSFNIAAMDAKALGVDGKNVQVDTQDNAEKSITTINDAINKVSKERAKMGAIQNRLEHTISNLDTSAENLQNAESRIRDVDMAAEMVEYSKNNILQQAAQSMLAQANQSTQGVLSLLR